MDEKNNNFSINNLDIRIPTENEIAAGPGEWEMKTKETFWSLLMSRQTQDHLDVLENLFVVRLKNPVPELEDYQQHTVP